MKSGKCSILDELTKASGESLGVADSELAFSLIGDYSQLEPSDWIEANVFFPRKLYPTSMPGEFRFDRQPWIVEILNSAALAGHLETIVWKCSQCGVTESLLQNILRWQLCNRPLPIMWLAGQQDFLETFWDERILPGLVNCLSSSAKEILGTVSTAGTTFSSPNGGSVAGVWASNKSGLKGRSFGLVLCDEVSTYASFAMEKVRPRIANYPDGKIYAVSALDCRGRLRATKEDPLFIEWESTDRREWMMKDPETGKDFSFRFGWKKDEEEHNAGIRWSPDAKKEDGEWDMFKVRETAHFETEDGTVITEAERFKIVSTGRWVETADGRPGARGYRIPAMICANHSFGDLAVDFLRAKRAGAEQLRTFVCEMLAEEWVEDRIVIGENAVDRRRADYQVGEHLATAIGTSAPYVGMERHVIVSGDVQKLTLFWLAREWVMSKSGNADSGLVDWEEVVEWAKFEELSQKVDAYASIVDLRYKLRRQEVIDAAFSYPHIIPAQGSDSRMKNILQLSTIDALEGKKGGGRRRNQIGVLTFDSWVFSFHLFELLQGRKNRPNWYIPKNTDREYVRHLMAEEFRDGKVVERHPGAPNHLLDCEKMQVVAAMWFRWLTPFRASMTVPEDAGSGRTA